MTLEGASNVGGSNSIPGICAQARWVYNLKQVQRNRRRFSVVFVVIEPVMQ
jgi:hypothetical protein